MEWSLRDNRFLRVIITGRNVGHKLMQYNMAMRNQCRIDKMKVESTINKVVSVIR